MNKSELIKFIAEDAQMTQVDAAKALNSFMKGVEEALKRDEKVTLVGFGTWKVVDRAARTGINPQTKEKIKIKAKKVVKFNSGSNLEL
ncbi:MAG: HU family DNA-binding protein [Bacteroidales bacterium]|jgi:DNA-binding protein HU-beta